PADRVGKRFMNRVDIGLHCVGFKVFDNGQTRRRLASTHLHRYRTNHISELYDMREGTAGNGGNCLSVSCLCLFYAPRHIVQRIDVSMRSAAKTCTALRTM